MRRVAVLRPEPGNACTAAAVEAMGFQAVRLPLFAVRPIDWRVPPGRYDALLMTSANAVRHGGAGLDELKGWPVFAVGAATAAAARAAGFTVAASGSGDARAIVAAAGGARLLHLAGRERIALAGVAAVAVYVAEALPVAPAAVTALADAVALLHSARAAARFAALADAGGVRGRIRVAGLSPAVIAAAGEGWEMAEAASAPRDDALLALAATLAATRGVDRAGAGADNRGR